MDRDRCGLWRSLLVVLFFGTASDHRFKAREFGSFKSATHHLVFHSLFIRGVFLEARHRRNSRDHRRHRDRLGIKKCPDLPAGRQVFIGTREMDHPAAAACFLVAAASVRTMFMIHSIFQFVEISKRKEPKSNASGSSHLMGSPFRKMISMLPR